MQVTIDLRGRTEAQVSCGKTQAVVAVVPECMLALARERARAEAVERLVALLERTNAKTPAKPLQRTPGRADSLSQLARLRAARASYALATLHGMEQVGPGAWIRRRRYRRA